MECIIDRTSVMDQAGGTARIRGQSFPQAALSGVIHHRQQRPRPFSPILRSGGRTSGSVSHILLGLLRACCLVDALDGLLQRVEPRLAARSSIDERLANSVISEPDPDRGCKDRLPKQMQFVSNLR